MKFFKSKPDLPPGMNASDVAPAKQQQKIPGCSEGEMANLSKSAKRNMKRKEKRKQQHHHQDADVDVDGDVDSLSCAVEVITISEGGGSTDKTAVAVSSSCPDESTAASEKAKKIKNLKKKMRQIEELQQKVDSGEIKEPTKDQLEKLGRAGTLEAELQQLEAD